MARSRGTRLVAKRLADDNAEVNDLDYFGKFTSRKRPKNDSNDPGQTSEAPQQQTDDRAARIARREAAKLGQTLGVQGQVVSPRQGTTQQSEEGESEDESGDAAEDEGDDDEEDGGPDGVDHVRITQAMNQARNRNMKPTINGIGSRQRVRQPQDAEVSSDDGEDSQEEPLESQSLDGKQVHASRNANDRSRSKRGGNEKAPQQKNQRGLDGSGRRSQEDQTDASSPDEDESEVELSSETEDEVAEDTAFFEPPEQDEETLTIKVFINSMGGIFKTLQHSAWTGSTHWIREFESDDSDDGQKTCKTSSGKALMSEIQGLNDILEEAANPLADPSADAQDSTKAMTAYLRTRSEDIQQHFARITQTVDDICCRRLHPSTQDKQRRLLVRDMSRRLIPMLIITVKKACGICRSEDSRSKISLYLDSFRLQFFLRPLGWADRLHQALERCLKRWPEGKKSQQGVNESQGSGNEALEAEKEARSTFESQFAALKSAVKKAERNIQKIGTQAETQKREAEVKRLERERMMTRQREIAAEKQREQEEKNRKDKKAFQAFYEATRAIRSQPDPLKQLWDQDQATLPEHLRATYTVRATQGRSSSAQGQTTVDTARPQGGPSRHARVESVNDSDDPFSPNYRHPPTPPPPNSHASNNGVRQNPESGPRSSQQARNASRPWSDEEDKAMIKAIRYKRNYDVVSMAQKLQRSEEDVARKAAFLKQGYREAYNQKGREIPAWAL